MDLESVKTDEEKEEAPRGTSIEERLETALKAREATAIDAFVEKVEKLSTPDRSKVPDVEVEKEKTGSRFGFGDVRASIDPLYRQLPEAIREIRNPRSDDAMQQWLLAVRNNRFETADKIGRSLDDEYLQVTGKRADTLYGTPDTTSGIGDGTGGPLVPLPLANLIILARNSRGRMRALAQRFTSNANTLRIPTGGVATATMQAEGAISDANEPTLSSVLLSKKKMQSHFVASDEMVEDSSFNLIGLYTERAGSAMGALEDVQICTSNGTAPNITGSLASATITAFTEATITVMIYVDVVNMFFALPEAYHADAAWFGNAAMMGFLSTITDGNGRPIFSPGLAVPGVVTDSIGGNGAQGAIFGRPVYLVPATAGSLFLGNMRDYALLDGGGIQVRASEHAGWATDTVEWKITQRVDGVLADATGWREMAGITSVA